MGTPAAPRLITVGIPVFNGRSLLRSCLSSVIGSSLPHDRYEVVVADDGSDEPETAAILEEFATDLASEAGFFRVVRLGVNSGGAARPRNRILDEAGGEYVFFVDSDDTIGDLALERIADALATTPADWVALHQVAVNGRATVLNVRPTQAVVPRERALTTLTVHKVFRRAEIERQRLRFDEGLPSGQDISFAFSYVLGASRFLMLGGYDYYHLTQHGGNPNEPVHLSRLASNAAALVEKNHRILASMVRDLATSELPADERRRILYELALPRVLVQQRYLSSVAALGRGAGMPALRRLRALLADVVTSDVDAGELKRGLTLEHLAVVADADWAGLEALVKQSAPPPRARLGFVDRWVGRARRLADLASGLAGHRRVLSELATLRRSVIELQTAQVRLESELRAERLRRDRYDRDLV